LGKDSSGGAYDSEVLKVILDPMSLKSGVHPLFFAELPDVAVENGSLLPATFLTKERPMRVQPVLVQRQLEKTG
jgi:hypothetical protein